MHIRLYDFAGSPFCIKVRAILDFKQLAYERLPVVSPRYFELRRRNPARKVPALEVDGEFIADSTDIALALDQLKPEPPLLPDDPKRRADNHILEDWADESLYFLALHHRWVEPAGRREAARIFPQPLATVLGPAIARMARRQLHAQGVGRKSFDKVARDLERSLEAVAARLDGAYLLGDTPYLCDFAVMGQLVYLGRTPAGAAAIARHPAIGPYLERMRALRRA